MKTNYLFLLLFFAVTSYAQPSFDIDSMVKVQHLKNEKMIGTLFPDFKAMQGKMPVSNKDFAGKVTLINFWFEGCKPCMAEMVTLNKLNQKFKPNKDFEFVSFTFDNDEAVKRVKDKQNINFKIFQTTVEECHRLNFQNGFPISMVLDRNGKIKYIHMVWGQPEKKFLENLVRKLGDTISKEL